MTGLLLLVAAQLRKESKGEAATLHSKNMRGSGIQACHLLLTLNTVNYACLPVKTFCDSLTLGLDYETFFASPTQD